MASVGKDRPALKLAALRSAVEPTKSDVALLVVPRVRPTDDSVSVAAHLSVAGAASNRDWVAVLDGSDEFFD